MESFLIDTNVFWEIICQIAGINLHGKKFDIERLKGGTCFISEITRVEIMSVMGKYARGEQAQWQNCGRQIKEDGARCVEKFYNPGRKRWKNKQITIMRKLVKDIFEGNSALFHIEVIPVNEQMIKEAERFINYSFKYKFASLDAMIAGTAVCCGDSEIIVVTHDRSLQNALIEDGIHIMEEIESYS